jgi:glycosyltransferase involved in cell wall biosynthesis
MMKLNSSGVKKTNNERVRVLFVSFTYIIDVYQSKLNSIAKSGQVEVGLLAPSKWKMRDWNQTFSLKSNIKDLKLFPARVWFFNGRNGGFLYPTWNIFIALLKFKPHVIQLEQEVFSLSTFQIAFWAWLLRIPVVIFCWENMDRSFFVLRRMSRLFVLKTAKFIIPGNQGAYDLLRLWGYDGPMEIMPQIGVDTYLFKPPPNNSKRSEFNIGFIGRLVPEKGIDTIFKAAKQLKEDGHEFQITICGSGSEKEHLLTIVNDYNLDSQTNWIGRVEYRDVPQVIEQFDVLVLPSRTMPGKGWSEQFGHVLIEAMAMGVPVFGSSSGAIPEVIGRSDLIFQEDNSIELNKLFAKLMTNLHWRKEVSEYCLSRVNENFTDARIAEKLVSIWKNVLNNI